MAPVRRVEAPRRVMVGEPLGSAVEETTKPGTFP